MKLQLLIIIYHFSDKINISFSDIFLIILQKKFYYQRVISNFVALLLE